jgi:hypothetical protein
MTIADDIRALKCTPRDKTAYATWNDALDRAEKAEAEVSRLRDLLDEAMVTLEFYSCTDGCNGCPENERDMISCGWTARATLAKIGGTHD